MKGLRYSLVLGLTLAALGAAAAFVILRLKIDVVGTAPVAIGTSPPPPPPAAPASLPPATAAPPPHPAPTPPPQPTAGPSTPAAPLSPPWRPTPEQALRDTLYLLTRSNRDPEAAVLLDRWIARHPADTSVLRESARLLVRTGRADEGLARYRALLAQDSSAATRAEYAGALLAAGRYDDAAAEYRRLAEADPTNRDYRLGLGRALAWGGHPREAAAELAQTPAPRDTASERLLNAVRRDYEPSAAEAAAWVREEPDDPDYRLALARALVRDGHADHARAQYDTLLMRGPSLALMREAAGVYATARDSVGAARLLGEAVALAPSDTLLRRDYARALAWSGDGPGAIREYSVLLERSRDPEVLAARGQLYLWAGNDRAAEADLRGAAGARHAYETDMMLGDLYHWRGDAPRATAAYQDALSRRPGDPTALGGLEATRRAARAGRIPDDDEGFASTTRFVSDNAGFDFVATELSGGVGLGDRNRTILFASGDVRRVSRDTAGLTGPRRVDGYWVQGGVAQWLGHFRASARVGLLHHSDVPDIGTWAFKGEVIQPNLRLSVVVSRSAAYETLRAGRTLGLAVAPGVDPALRATALSGTVSVPLGNGADLWASAEHLWLSDTNDRTSVSVAVRYPLVKGLSAVYSGGGLGFGDLDPLYWSPRHYVLQALGLEYRIERPSGFRLAFRGLPGVAFLSEQTVPGGPAASRSVFQWSATLDLAYRRPRWELGVFGAYGRDRSDAGYEAGSGLARLRWYW